MDCKDIKVGTTIPKLVIEVSLVKAIMYCGVTWDFARFHYDPEFVQQFGFGKPVLDPQMHGAFAARMLSDWVLDSARIRRLSMKYLAPCYLGDTITYGGEVTSRYKKGNIEYVDCDLRAEREQGEQTMIGAASLLFY